MNIDPPEFPIVVDVGNSRLRMATVPAIETPVLPNFDETSLAEYAPIPLRRLGAWATPQAGTEEAEQFLADFEQLLPNVNSNTMVVVSVVPGMSRLLAKSFPGLSLIDQNSELPFELAMKNRGEVGSDRLCNIAAAVALGLKNAIVVDVGTATTVDVLVDGVFVGGLIAPGMAAAGVALTQSTAQLPEIPFQECGLEAGRTTASAMGSGIFHAGVGGVEALINGILSKYGGTLPVVVTGGLGKFLAGPSRHFDPDWTMRGALNLLSDA